jgi:hypothetical protein
MRLGGAPVQFALRLAKALGIDPNKECDDRKGILQIKTPDGDWITIVYEGDPESREAKVLPCSHIALDAALFYMRQVMEEVMLGNGTKKVDGDEKNIFIPKPEDFRFLHLDEEPPEVEVTVTDEAAALLSKFTSGAAS